MGALAAGLVAPALGIVLSPLAVMALVAELLSRRYRANGSACLAGWALGVIVVMAAALAIFTAIDFHPAASSPTWRSVVRLLIAVVLLIFAVWVYRRGQPALRQMAGAATPTQVQDAAPHLPGWMARVEQFTPARSLALGFGLSVAASLHRMRTWIATHTNALNAALILVIGVLQLQKVVSALLG